MLAVYSRWLQPGYDLSVDVSVNDARYPRHHTRTIFAPPFAPPPPPPQETAKARREARAAEAKERARQEALMALEEAKSAGRAWPARHNPLPCL